MATTTHGNTSKMPHLDLKEVHACLDYTLTNYSHLDYRRLDYKNVWTIPIGLLVHLDYTPKLHCHVNYIRSDYFGLCNVFSYKVRRLQKT